MEPFRMVSASVLGTPPNSLHTGYILVHTQNRLKIYAIFFAQGILCVAAYLSSVKSFHLLAIAMPKLKGYIKCLPIFQFL